jgi:hypothetical protein
MSKLYAMTLMQMLMSAFQSDKMILIQARAHVEETVLSEEAVRLAINSAMERASADKAAATDPIGPNQKPRMLHISAWMCHAGEPNKNGAGFSEADLEEAVNNGLFVAPYFGMIDWNHDFNAYGCWYKAEYKFDTAANQWGILAHGAVFAWRYAEVADKVLASMARQGWVDVSMACMPGWYEPAKTKEGKEYRLIRKPVFFTTSLLDVDPADPHGRGNATESTDSTPESRTRELSQASSDNGTVKEEVMNELIEKVEAMLGEQKEVLAPLVEASVKLASVEKELESANEALKLEQDKVTELESAKTEIETAKAELEVALDAAKGEVAAMSEELTALREFKANIDTAEAERMATAKRESVLAQVPEHVRESLEKSAKKDAIIDSWVQLSEDEWALKLESFSLAGERNKSFSERSAEEGNLSSVSDNNDGGFAIRRWRK